MEKNLINIFKDFEIKFIKIPAGNYTVGVDNENIKLQARPPQWKYDFYNEWVTQKTEINTDEYYISKEPIRLNSWTKIVKILIEKNNLNNPVSENSLIFSERKKIKNPFAEILPTAGEEQAASFESKKLVPKKIPCQIVKDPFIEVEINELENLIEILNNNFKSTSFSIPRWYEWEIASRGIEGYLYPWGNEIDLKELSIEMQDYSVDEESTMGYYSYDQTVYYIHSFGKYSSKASPFGLTGYTYGGREWNLCYKNKPLDNSDYILRSITDLGQMTFRIPGIRYNTMCIGKNFSSAKQHLAYSGPILCCYAHPDVGLKNSARGKKLFPRAGFRLLIRK